MWFYPAAEVGMKKLGASLDTAESTADGYYPIGSFARLARLKHCLIGLIGCFDRLRPIEHRLVATRLAQGAHN